MKIEMSYRQLYRGKFTVFKHIPKRTETNKKQQKTKQIQN